MRASLAISALIGLAAAVPVAMPKPSFSSLVKRFEYHMYQGTGAISEFWPTEEQWVSSLDELFTMNQGVLSSSCAQFGVPNNSPAEIADIKTAIESVSKSSGVDARYIFAVMMQESKGCVRAPTTNYGVRNPGLFQCHNGEASCNDGTVMNPCPANVIQQMVSEGVAGTKFGDGLSQLITASGASDASKYYKASRMYNSGSIAATGNLGDGIATKCYSSDVANRLLGWVDGESTCCLDHGCAVGAPAPNPNGGDKPPSSGDKPPSSGDKPPAPAPPSSKPDPSKPSTTPAPAPAPTPSGTAGAPPPEKTSTSFKAAGAPSECKSTYLVVAGENCIGVAGAHGLSLEQFMTLNPSLRPVCDNLLAGKEYCVQ